MKKFKLQYGIGRAKYVVSSHDGEKTHADGSEFFDCNIFRNKKKLNIFIKDLISQGYKEI